MITVTIDTLHAAHNADLSTAGCDLRAVTA